MTDNEEKEDLVNQLRAPRRQPSQPLYVSGPLKQTARVMVKDENLCVHCSLCAERCPTAAWDMQKSLFKFPRAIDHARQDKDGQIHEEGTACLKTG
jgi:NAD-dependent dihydropyrimidine dehydrogenase PreA subunit